MPKFIRPTYGPKDETVEIQVERRIREIFQLKNHHQEVGQPMHRLTFADLTRRGNDDNEILIINKNVIAWIGISQVSINVINQLVKQKRIFPVIADLKQFVKYCYNKHLLAFPMTLDPTAELDGVHWCPIEFIFTRPLTDFEFTSVDAKEIA